MDEMLILATIIAPMALALTEMFKRTSTVNTNYLPFVALGVGFFIGYASFPFTDLDLIERLWSGGVAGLTATGLFEVSSHGKNVVKGDKS